MLDSKWVEADLALECDGVPVTGRLKCNWGTLEVAMLSPWVGVTDQIVSQGGSFALLVGSDPERGYARDGAITARGMQLGRELLASLHARCRALAANSETVAERLRAYRQELDAHGQSAKTELEPLHARRRELKAALASGALTNHAYQPLLTALQKQVDEVEVRRREADSAASDRVRDWCAEKLGLPIDARFLVHWFDAIAG